MLVDLHTHTHASDGTLSPDELLARAAAQDVQVLAITDHDTVAGVAQLLGQARQSGPELVAGVELSCTWGKRLIHVVGLQIDIGSASLQARLDGQQQAREQRAQLIAAKLESLGFAGAEQGARYFANGGQIGRPHFAQFLVAEGHVANTKQAFKRYLGAGKAGDVKLTWPSMAEAVSWIEQAGGVAVLAHPYHYKLTQTKLNALLKDFKAAGGGALEVVSGAQTRDRSSHLATLADRYQLLASIGSDFHRPDQPWNELGCMGTLPSACRPVWSAWE